MKTEKNRRNNNWCTRNQSKISLWFWTAQIFKFNHRKIFNLHPLRSRIFKSPRFENCPKGFCVSF